jgi:hypothetical protein
VSESPDMTVARILEGVRFRFSTEEELQLGVAAALAEYIPEREVILGPKDRVDFLLWGVGIEIKIKGGISALTRQLMRYAQHERVRSLVVVTSREQYRLQLPATMNGKPLRVVSLRGAFA